MMQEATTLVEKLTSIGAGIGAATTNESSTFARERNPARRALSDASTCAADRGRPGINELELLLAEVLTARAILAQRELHREEALRTYCTSLVTLIRAYEQSQTERRVSYLASSLAMARTVLQDGVKKLASWLAIGRSMARQERFVAVPDRFVSRESAELRRDEDDERIETWMDVDTIEG